MREERPTSRGARGLRSSRTGSVLPLLLVLIVLLPSGTTSGLSSTASAPVRPVALGDHVAATVLAESGTLPHVSPRHPSTVRLSNDPLPPGRPRLSSWGASGIPPGAPLTSGAPLPGRTGAPASFGHINASWNNSVCSGLWPDSWGGESGQGRYLDGCYGHDEPAIEFFSPLRGSGGNVSWNFTLPIDRSSTQLQSDLYTAVWFGLTLADTNSWLHQCFLELQLYPDSSFGSGPTYDQWAAAAVAWQIDPTNGAENTCAYVPLTITGGSSTDYLALSGGDHVLLNLTGWAGDPTGETIDVADLTSGARSSTSLTEATGGPLDPAFASNDFENSLEWTPGGEFPVTFAFETGHAASGGFPENNSYGGCSPGIPPSTRSDPAVPCPSYDPGSWINDSLAPWRIAAPTFFNASASMTPVQVGFGQPEGGIRLIDRVSNGSCTGREGSAWCSYPWYSYSCADAAFKFGATDYPGTTDDFGQSRQYGSTYERNNLGLGFYPPNNFSMPSCATAPAELTLSANSHGLVNFLSTNYAFSAALPNASIGGLDPGWYSLSAQASPGFDFDGWRLTGALRLAGASTDPWAAIEVLGDGAIEALFGPPTSLTKVSDPNCGTEILSTPFRATATTLVDFSVGCAAVELPPGIYGLMAYSGMGSMFVSWASSPGLTVASSTSPETWLIVTGSASSATIHAITAISGSSSSLTYEVGGGTGGKLRFSSGPPTVGPTTVGVGLGSFLFQAVPAAGYGFDYWSVGGIAEAAESGATTEVAIEGYEAVVEAWFLPIITVVSPGGAADIASIGRVGNGSAQPLAKGYWQFAPLSPPGVTFVRWSSSNASAAWIETPGLPTTWIEVNASATITLLFASAGAVRVDYWVSPRAAASMIFDGLPGILAGSANTTLANGSYPIAIAANPGYRFSKWVGTGSVTIGSWSGGALADVQGSIGNLTAILVPVTIAVSVASPVVSGAGIDLNGSVVTTDVTLLMLPGAYAISLVGLGGSASFVGWAATPGLAVSGGTLQVEGPGTIEALIAPFFVAAPTVRPPRILPGGGVQLTENVSGTGPFRYEWAGLPGCSLGDAIISCSGLSPGNYSAVVTVIDPFGSAASSPPALVVVDVLALTASVTASPSATDVDFAVAVSVVPTDGIGPYSFDYLGLPGCPSVNRSSLHCVVTGATTSPMVQVSDAIGLVGTFAIPLVVHPTLSLGPMGLGNWTDEVGSTTLLSVRATGGTAPFSYGWRGLPTGCAPRNASTLLCYGSETGSWTVDVAVTDAVGAVASTFWTYSTLRGPSIALASALPSAWDAGRPIEIGLTRVGGQPPYLLELSGLLSICSDLGNLSYLCDPSAIGPANLSAELVDSYNVASWLNATLNVTPPPTISLLRADPATIGLGELTTVEVAVTGGSGNASVSYGGLPPGCTSANSLMLSCQPEASGSFAIEVSVNDSSGGRASAIVDLTVTPPPAFLTPLELLGLVALLALVVVAVVVACRRRGGGRPAGPGGRPRDARERAERLEVARELDRRGDGDDAVEP